MPHPSRDRTNTQVLLAAADEVVVPASMSCCAFAGDGGLLRHELTPSATTLEAAQVRAADAYAHVSANRTCEIGLEQATDRPYASALLLLEWATRPTADQPVWE